MDLTLRNIGRLSDMSISISGLTVILGENSTGKSTILKSLYAVAEAPVDIRSKKTDEIRRWLELHRLTDNLELSTDPDAETRIENVRRLCASGDGIDSKIGFESLEKLLNEDSYSKYLEILIERNIRQEFGTLGQLRNLRNTDSVSRIRLSNGDAGITALLDTADGLSVECPPDLRPMFGSVFYYDTPFILDDFRRSGDHRGRLASAIMEFKERNAVDVLSTEESTGVFAKIVGSVIDGEFQQRGPDKEYVENDGIHIDLRNMASGMKVFAMLEILVSEGKLMPASLLILDEPEAHVHPKWINTLGKLIVFMAKEMSIRIVMTTHNPQLLLAIQAHSLEQSLHTDYYSLHDENGASELVDVSEKMGTVYETMSDAFDEVNDLYWSLLDRGSS